MHQPLGGLVGRCAPASLRLQLSACLGSHCQLFTIKSETAASLNNLRVLVGRLHAGCCVCRRTPLLTRWHLPRVSHTTPQRQQAHHPAAPAMSAAHGRQACSCLEATCVHVHVQVLDIATLVSIAENV